MNTKLLAGWLALLFLCSGILSAQPVKTDFQLVSWRFHETAVYQLSFTTTVKTNFAAIGSLGMDTSLTGMLEGEMQQVCIDKGEDKWSFYVCFPSMRRFRFPLSATEQASVAQILRDGFYFSQYSIGIIDSIWLPAKTSASAEHIILQLLEHYQYCLPAGNDSNLQQALFLTEGPVWATYQMGQEIGPSRNIRLTALSLQRQSSPVNMIARTLEYEADVHYDFSNNQLKQVAGQVVRKAKVNHKTTTTLTNSFKFVRQPVSKKKIPVPVKPPAHFQERPLYYPEKKLQQVQAANLAKSKRISIAGILYKLNQNETARDEQLQDKLATDIKISFLTNKDSLHLLREVFMESPVNGITFKTLRTGIVTAATPYAQYIVSDYILHYKDDGARLGKIIPSAGLVHAPLVSLQNTMEKFAFDSDMDEAIRSAALLALGNMAGNLRSADTVRADSLSIALAMFLQTGQDHMLLLSVLGNCGAGVALPYIRPLLSDSNEIIRGYAYYALRFIHQPVVDSLYEQALKVEQAPEVLTNIFNGLFLRGYAPGLSEELLHLVEQHATESIRLEALRVLFEWSYRQPALLNNIREVAAGNSNDTVRKTALQFLARVDE